MSLEKNVCGASTGTEQQTSYLPFATQYLEEPKIVGYDVSKPMDFTSMTISTLKFIPLIDDGD